MTVITKPTSEKKSDNVPLVTNIEVDSASHAKDLEAGNVENDQPIRSKVLLLRVINDRVYSFWALIYVLLMSLLIIIMMVYGENIYKTLGNAFNDENDAFQRTGTITVNDKLLMQDLIDLQNQNNDYKLSDVNFDNLAAKNNQNKAMMNNEDIVSEYKGNFELDLRDDSYEKIVPVLPQSNYARFIHDFSANVTGIVDVEGQRCFVMPLNHSSVLPPKSLYDLMFKMSTGYYAIDTKNIMHNMRVVKPAIEDLTEYGIYIVNDCAGYPTYKLEKIVSGGV